MQPIWMIVIVVGPAMLLGVIIWAMVRNRQQSTTESRALTERATKTQREEQAAENEKIGGPLG